MQDSIIKGTGNSRYLKSSLEGITTWEQFRAALLAGTLPIDLNGVNADGFQQLGDPLNKATLLKDATAKQFGLTASAVPDDVLNYLGQYAEYWWKYVRPAHDVYSVTMSDLAKTREYFTTGTIYISKEVTVDDNGKVTFVNPISCYNNDENSEHMNQTFETIKNNIPCYISPSESMQPYGTTDIFVYVPTGATVTTDNSNSTYTVCKFNYCVAFGGSASVLAKVCTLDKETIAAGTALYTHSTDRNAYPDSGEVEGVTYEYLGVPFENLITAPKIATGSYMGTGVYGKSNVNTLSFDFPPKIVFIRGPEKTTDAMHYVCLISDAIYAEALYESGGTSESLLQYVTWSDNSVSWYNSASAIRQLNKNKANYAYVAIG